MNKIYFCTSSNHILPTLSLLLKDNIRNTVTVITYLESLKNFFDNYINIKDVSTMLIQVKVLPKIHFKNPIMTLLRMLYIKTLCLKYFKKIKQCEIYFYSGYLYYTTYFIKKLSKMNKVYYYDTDKYKYSIEKVNSHLRQKLKKRVLKLLFNVSYDFVDIENEKIPILNKSYFNENRITVINNVPDLDLNMLNSLKNFLLNTIKGKKVLIMASNVNQAISDKNLYNSWRRIINVILSTYSKEQVIIKNHPRRNFSNFVPFAGLDEMPNCIPGELLLENEFDFIISFYSTFIINAIKKIGKSTKIVCVMNLFEYKSEKYRKTMLQTFGKLKSEKYYIPKNLKEFKKILI